MFVSGLSCKEYPVPWISALLTHPTVCTAQHHPKKIRGQLISMNTFPVNSYLRSLTCYQAPRILSGFLWPSWDSDCSSTAPVFACCPAFCKRICLSCLDYMSAVELVFEELSSPWLCEDQLLWEMMAISCVRHVLTSCCNRGKKTEDGGGQGEPWGAWGAPFHGLPLGMQGVGLVCSSDT